MPNKFGTAIITADMTDLLQNIKRHLLSIAGCKFSFKAALRNFIASSCSKASIGENRHILVQSLLHTDRSLHVGLSRQQLSVLAGNRKLQKCGTTQPI